MTHICDGRDPTCRGCDAIARRDELVREVMTTDDQLDDITRLRIWNSLATRLATPRAPRRWPIAAGVAVAAAAMIIVGFGVRGSSPPTLVVGPDSTLTSSLGPHTRAALVGPGELAVVGTPGDATVVSLRTGRLLADFTGGPGRSLVIEAPGAVITVVGTLFAVETTSAGTCVSVAHGTVRVTTAVSAVAVRAGEAFCTQAGRTPIAPDVSDQLARHALITASADTVSPSDYPADTSRTATDRVVRPTARPNVIARHAIDPTPSNDTVMATPSNDADKTHAVDPTRASDKTRSRDMRASDATRSNPATQSNSAVRLNDTPRSNDTMRSTDATRSNDAMSNGATRTSDMGSTEPTQSNSATRTSDTRPTEPTQSSGAPRTNDASRSSDTKSNEPARSNGAARSNDVTQPPGLASPPTAEELYRRAETALAAGDDAAADRALERLVADHASSPLLEQALYEHARIAYRHREWAAARRAVDRVLALPNTRLAEPARYLGCRVAVETRDGEARSCLVAFRTQWARSSHDRDVLGLLVQLDHAAGGCPGAAASIAELVQRYPQDRLATAWRARCSEAR